MRNLHVIQGPNVACDACEKIAFFAFHAFVVEDSRFQQNRVRAKLYNCGACVCKGNVEIRLAGSFLLPAQTTGETGFIDHHIDCNSKNVMYMIRCYVHDTTVTNN